MGCKGTKHEAPNAQDNVPVASSSVSTTPAGSTSTAPACSTSTAPAASSASSVSDPWFASAPAASPSAVAPPAGVQQASDPNSLQASAGSSSKDDAAPTKNESALEKFTSQAKVTGKVLDKEFSVGMGALLSGFESCVNQATATSAGKSFEQGLALVQKKAEQLEGMVTKGAENVNQELKKKFVSAKPVGNMVEGEFTGNDSEHKEPLRYIEKPPAGHTDDTKCSDYVKQMEPQMPGIKFLEEILSECKKVSDSKGHTEAARTVANSAMVFAITLFTFDLCQIKKDDEYDRSNNFYFILNIMLRERSAAFLAAAEGYMYYLMTGLSRLPSADGVVFRGIDKEKASDALKKFKQGTTSSFSAFSSSSPEWSTAYFFAKGGGVMLKIQLLDENSWSRDITAMSLYDKTETEVLLLPNFKVSVGRTTEQNDIHVIEMCELLSDASAADF